MGLTPGMNNSFCALSRGVFEGARFMVSDLLPLLRRGAYEDVLSRRVFWSGGAMRSMALGTRL